MISEQHKMILSSGRFSGTSRQQLAAAFDALAAAPDDPPLVIHFHGGLVDTQSGEALAERLFPRYQAAGGYPLFVLWQSGLIETLKNNWREMLGEQVFALLVEKAMQFILGKLDQAPGEKGGKVELPTSLEVRGEIQAAQAAGEAPYAERDPEAADLDEALTPAEQAQFEALLKDDPAFVHASAQLSRPEVPELNPALQAEISQAQEGVGEGERGIVSAATLAAAGLRILTRALKRFANRRDHGLYTTVVEEAARELKGDLIGGLVWKHIKKDTLDAFGASGDRFGGTALLEEIARLWAAGRRPRLILIGHSAGSIYICNLLQKAADALPPEARFEVIFLAPGCSFQLLDQTLQRAGERLAGFRCFGMKDELEARDAILPPVYLCSLLYCVAGLLEEQVDLPLVGMARYHGASPSFDPGPFAEIQRVRQRLAAFPQPWVWSESHAGPGLSTAARSHGDFDNDETTLESLAFLISQGGF